MPKKFAGENSKAAVAKARKQAAKEEESTRKQKAIEDEYWKDDDKQLAKKQQRKEEQEKKRLEAAQRKAESKASLEEELSKIKIGGKQTQSKVTRAEIEAEAERRQQAATIANKKEEVKTHVEKPIEENVNRLQVDGLEARSVEDAISVLSEKEATEIDRHPERRMKAAYTAFEDERLPQLKAEHKNMRLSQLKQLLWKEWLKSPRNPTNQKPQA
ncbi:coiled-coil domain-containing protein 124 [Cloeon dipterum]|uniref:coiled-coil domain-containing protein 124 n=1 Tax=Cloeon dipterum TaxID=197152 RepID=UPI00321F75B0